MSEQNAGTLPAPIIGADDLFLDRESIKAVRFVEVEKEDPTLEPSEEVHVLLDVGIWVSSSNEETVQAFRSDLQKWS